MDDSTKLELLKQFSLNNPGVFRQLKTLCDLGEKARHKMVDSIAESRNRGRAAADFSASIVILRESASFEVMKDFLANNKPYED